MVGREAIGRPLGEVIVGSTNAETPESILEQLRSRGELGGRLPPARPRRGRVHRPRDRHTAVRAGRHAAGVPRRRHGRLERPARLGRRPRGGGRALAHLRDRHRRRRPHRDDPRRQPHRSGRHGELPGAEALGRHDRPSFLAMVDRVRMGERGRQTVTFGARTYDTTGVPLPDSVAGPGSAAFIATDVTDHVAKSRRFQALVENLEEVTAVLDADGTVRYVSPAVERLDRVHTRRGDGRRGRAAGPPGRRRSIRARRSTPPSSTPAHRSRARTGCAIVTGPGATSSRPWSTASTTRRSPGSSP